MVVTRWDPFRELATLQNRVNSLFQDYGRPGQDELTTTSSFVPAVDVYEDEHKVTLKLEIPGIKQEDVDIRLENNTLTVRGERNFERKRRKRISIASSVAMAALLVHLHCRTRSTPT